MNRMRATAFSLLSLALAVALSACGGDEGDETKDATESSASPTPSESMSMEPSDEASHDDNAADQMIEITIAGGTVTPEPGTTKVTLGDTVMIMVTSDVDDEVHVHGYDKEFELKAGEMTSVTFTADIPGTFEVETHESGTVLTELEVS